ncbi:MAG: hypothetical protein U0353_00120 [Sandaracinus sp.]
MTRLGGSRAGRRREGALNDLVRRGFVGAFALAGAGCGLVLDATPPRRDAGIDATIEGRDANVPDADLPDANVPDANVPDASLLDAARDDAPGLDAFTEDAAEDAGCGPCAPSDLCEEALCMGGTCVVRPRPNGTICHPSTGGCDLAETCDGTSTACPDDRLHPVDFVCHPSLGECDPPERCDGVTPDCPDDVQGLDFRNACAGGVCVGTRCMTGASCVPGRDCLVGCAQGMTRCVSPGGVTCVTAGIPAPHGTACRPSYGACDAAELCDGSSTVCPSDARYLDVVCRPSLGECDREERCMGGERCPVDELQGEGVACVDGGCRTCTGLSPDCTGRVRVSERCGVGGVCAVDGACLFGAPICVLPDSPCLLGTFDGDACNPTGSTVPPGTTCRAGSECVDDAVCDAMGVCPDGTIHPGAPCTGWCAGLGRFPGLCRDDGQCGVACPPML